MNKRPYSCNRAWHLAWPPCSGPEALGTDQAHLRLAGAEATVRRREELYSTGNPSGGTPEQRAMREAHERGRVEGTSGKGTGGSSHGAAGSLMGALGGGLL